MMKRLIWSCLLLFLYFAIVFAVMRQLTLFKRQTESRVFDNPNDINIYPQTESAIVYLISPHDTENLLLSLTLVCKNFLFLSHSPAYPIILMHDDRTSRFILRAMTATIVAQFPDTCGKTQIVFREIPWLLPNHYDPSKDPVVAWKNGFPNYNIMIRFWFRQVLYELSDFRYYMRLDTDSFVTSVITKDPFTIMKSKKYSYAYRGFDIDYPHVTEGFVQFIKSWISKSHHTRTLAKQNNFTVPMDNESSSYHPTSMYNNFEIVDISRFRQPDMQDFIETVDASNYMMTRRWGDAPLRYLQAKLVLNWDKEVWHFDSFYYYHLHHKFLFLPGSDQSHLDKDGTYWSTILKQRIHHLWWLLIFS